MVKPRVKQTKLSGLRPHEKNPRGITPERMADLKVALVEDELMLQARPLIALPDGRVICGNQRLAAAEELGWVTIPTVTVDLDEKTALLWMLRDNQGYGDWVDDQLASILVNIRSSDLVLTGFGADELAELLAPASKHDGIVLSDRFGAPPWSVLDARQGYWMNRKAKWLASGVLGMAGRERDLVSEGNPVQTDPRFYDKKRRAEAVHGREMSGAEFIADHYVPLSGHANSITTTGTSVFDPVLAELSYGWFCPPGGTILDPFAGGSTRGIVAYALGYRYHGIDVRKEQVEANREQAATAQEQLADLEDGPARSLPEWVVSDATRAKAYKGSPAADLVFSCPPYFDLEQYGDDPDDLSNMTWEEFSERYTAAVALACGRLREDRFAVFVVSEIRDKRGRNRGLIPLTVAAFAEAGLDFYNDAVLLTPLGTARVRASKMFLATRKLIRVHQNVLVFVKGDPAVATAEAGEVEMPDALLGAAA